MVYKKLIKILEFVLGMFGLWFFRPTLRPSSSSMFWGFINNCTQFVRGGVGDEALQPLLSFFSFESVTSLLENVQGLLNVKDTTFLVFHLVTFLYIVYSFSRMSHTLLNTVGQQIEAREQGDKSVTQAAANPTAIQAAAKPDSEAKTPAVAAVKKGKKHTDKTDRPVDDDSGERSSMPPDTQSGVKPTDTQSEAEATDDTQSEAQPTDTKSEAKSTGTRSGVQPTSTRSEAQPAATRSEARPTATRSGVRPTAARAGDTIESFSLKDLCGLRKDYTRRPDESIISWLVHLWDAAGEATILDGTEARHLGSLSHDPVIDQEMMREASPCSLWERVLRSVAQRYLCANDLYMQQTQWKTIEQGIQRLREMAVAEIVFSDDINTRNPDLVPCTPVMWRKLVRLGPQEYSSALAIMKRDETEEIVLDMAKKLRTYADAVHGPTHARIAALKTQFVDWLRAQIERQVQDPMAQAELIKEMAQRNANKACRRVILGLPNDPSPTLAQIIESCTKKAELFSTPERKPGLTNPKTVAAVSPEVKWQQTSAHWTVIEVDLPEKSRDLTVDHTGLNSEYFVIGDTAHTPMETEIAPMTIKGNMPKLILLAYCPQPPFYLAKGQIITQAIPTPAGVPVDDKTPDVYWAEVVGEDKPIMGCNLTRGRDHLHVEGLLDTRSHVTVIPEKMWPSHWDLQPVAGKLQVDVEFVEGSPQVTELATVVRAFEKFSETINLVTDSAYVAGVESRAEQAVLKDIENERLFKLL
ncbi:hypothetical protein DUI87_01409 [Hirundo rustica rustica]|uniref:Peptidase A2 domain-containing protein n=1 Tax=Hirundo rustica rustica TaxID=333673 RepID=A0A3M0L5D0_HIRRU|nr:hypothetical protein DUI87_01409 [Hirundo rustica rustica]